MYFKFETQTCFCASRYVEVNMDSAAIVWPLFNSLQAFWPGLQVCPFLFLVFDIIYFLVDHLFCITNIIVKAN